MGGVSGEGLRGGELVRGIVSIGGLKTVTRSGGLLGWGGLGGSSIFVWSDGKPSSLKPDAKKGKFMSELLHTILLCLGQKYCGRALTCFLDKFSHSPCATSRQPSCSQIIKVPPAPQYRQQSLCAESETWLLSSPPPLDSSLFFSNEWHKVFAKLKSRFLLRFRVFNTKSLETRPSHKICIKFLACWCFPGPGKSCYFGVCVNRKGLQTKFYSELVVESSGTHAQMHQFE